MLRLHPSHALVLLAAVVMVGAWTTRLDPGELDSSLGMLLFVQMFLASTGFAIRARQGHFDPLLTRGRSRARVAAAHLLGSAAPGAAAWLLLVFEAGALGSAGWSSALYGERMAALLIVSTVAWTLGFWLPRGSAGVVWMAVLMGFLAMRVEMIPAWTRALAPPAAVAMHAMLVTLCPFLLLGAHPALAPGSVPGALCLAATLCVAAMQAARRLDVYLVDRA